MSTLRYMAATMLAIWSCSGALAQGLPNGGTESGTVGAAIEGTGVAPRSQGGVRETQSSGFTLLEHGVWVMPLNQAVDSDQISTIDRPAQLRGLHPARAEPNARPSFRRSVMLPLISAAELRHQLPAGLLDAVIWTESHYNPIALSKAGAAGLAQLMPGTASALGIVNRYDPVASIEGGASYLRHLLDRFGSIHLALAAYNAGPRAVERAHGIPANGETPDYVRNVLSRWGMM
jgi:hypothetical protein